VALDQINLKLPPAVAERWRSAAAADGLSVRDWLLAQLEPPDASVAGDPLADRVAQLERTTADLSAAVAQLRGPAAAPRSPRPPAPSIASTPRPPAPAAAPADALETAELADRLGMRRGTLNARIQRAGGAREGLEIEGWRCLGRRPSARGGPPRAVWVPAAAD
jgi:hypothetical protein